MMWEAEAVLAVEHVHVRYRVPRQELHVVPNVPILVSRVSWYILAALHGLTNFSMTVTVCSFSASPCIRLRGDYCSLS